MTPETTVAIFETTDTVKTMKTYMALNTIGALLGALYCSRTTGLDGFAGWFVVVAVISGATAIAWRQSEEA